MNEIPTPRTDADVSTHMWTASQVSAEFARTLERELNAANEKLEKSFTAGWEGSSNERSIPGAPDKAEAFEQFLTQLTRQ